ncbi:META domain-containing protein [Chloroflexota bacterium]
MKKITLLLLVNTLLIPVILLAACNQTMETTPKLENTTWILQSYGQPEGLESVLKGIGFIWIAPEVTAIFDNTTGQVSGFGGVNTYGGTYVLTDRKLSIKGIFLTDLGGPQPLLDQEQEFLGLLRAAESFQFIDSWLQINN